jgi:5'-nucleotidase
MSSPRILLANDDGIHAPGLLALKIALTEAGFDVFVCAPHRPRSAASHALTLHKPLRAEQTTLGDGSIGWAVSGTPADCVLLGIEALTTQPIDLVVSGINHGPNLGWDVLYSGTVAAAREAAIRSLPAIAVSTADFGPAMHYETAANFIAKTLAPKVLAHGLPKNVLLNVNVPNVPEMQLKGVKIVPKSERRYKDAVETRLDPSGRAYYWIGGKPLGTDTLPGSDVEAVGQNYISITPLHLDLTAEKHFTELEHWQLTL